MTSNSALDTRLTTIENIIHSGNIVARSILITPEVSQTTYLNENVLLIDDSTSYNQSEILALNLASEPITVNEYNLSGRNLYSFEVSNDSTVATGTVSYTGISASGLSGYLPVIVSATTPSVVLNTNTSVPFKTDTITLNINNFTTFKSYTDVVGTNNNNIKLMKDNSDADSARAFEMLRSQYANSTVTVTSVSSLQAVVTGDGSGLVSASPYELSNNQYIYNSSLSFNLIGASFSISSGNVLKPHPQESNSYLPVYNETDIRTTFPVTVASVLDVANNTITVGNDSGTITILPVSNGVTYYNGDNSEQNLNDSDLTINGTLNTSNLGANQAEIDSNLNVLLGSSLENYLKVTITNNIPLITNNSLLTISSSGLEWLASDFGSSPYVSTYTQTITKTNDDLSDTSSVPATVTFTQYGSVGGIEAPYSQQLTSYTFTVHQQVGNYAVDPNLSTTGGIASGLTVVDIFPSSVNIVDTTYSVAPYSSGVSFNANSVLALYSGSNPNIIKYTITVDSQATVLNNDNKIFFVQNDNILADVTRPSFVMTLRNDKITDEGDYVLSSLDGKAVLMNTNAGVNTFTSEFGINTLSLSRNLIDGIVGGTDLTFKLLASDDVSQFRLSLRADYPDGTRDYSIITTYTGQTSDIAQSTLTINSATGGSYLQIPLNVGNISGFVVRIPLSQLASSNINKTSVISVPIPIEDVVRIAIWDGTPSEVVYYDIKPNWDPNAKTTIFFSNGSIIDVNLQKANITSSDINGTNNVIELDNSAASFSYTLESLANDMTPIATLASGAVDSANDLLVTSDSQLGVKLVSNAYFATNDQLVYYYIYKPIVELSNNYSESTGLVQATSTTSLQIDSRDGVVVSDITILGLTINSYNFHTIAGAYSMTLASSVQVVPTSNSTVAGNNSDVNGPAQTYDNNSTTYWQFNYNSGEVQLTYNFGSTVTLGSFTLTTDSTSTLRPGGLYIGGQSFAGPIAQTQTFNFSTPYVGSTLYVVFERNGSNLTNKIYELEFYTAPVVVNMTTSDSSATFNYPANRSGRTLFTMQTDVLVGQPTVSNTLQVKLRRVETEIVNENFSPVIAGYINYPLYDTSIPLKVNIGNTDLTFNSSNQISSDVKNTGFTLDAIDGVYYQNTNNVTYLKFATNQYYSNDDLSLRTITGDRTIDAPFINGNDFLSTLRFGKTFYDNVSNIVVDLSTIGDAVDYTYLGSTVYLANNELTTLQTLPGGLQFSLTDTFLGASFNPTITLTPLVVSVAFGGNTYYQEIDTSVYDYSKITDTNGDETGLVLTLGNKRVYDLIASPFQFTQKFSPAKLTIIDSESTPLLARNSDMLPTSYTNQPIEIGSTVYVRHTNNSTNLIVFDFTNLAGYDGSYVFNVLGGNLVMHRYTVSGFNKITGDYQLDPILSHIEKSVRFSKYNLVDGYMPVLSTDTSMSLKIKLTATEALMDEIIAANGGFLYINNDLFPVVVHKTGPMQDNPDKYIDILGNDILNTYQVSVVNAYPPQVNETTEIDINNLEYGAKF
jgi:hypothetical protein